LPRLAALLKHFVPPTLKKTPAKKK
jgi:hypothetical protein